MKNRIVIIVIFCLAATHTVHAQFLKDLKEQAVGRSKEVVQYKTNEKVTEKTSEGMDEVMNVNIREAIKGDETYEEYEHLKGVYNFSYHYQMKTVANDRTTLTDYLFQPGEAYYGVSPGEETDKLTIFETEHFFTFSGSGKNKSVKSSKPTDARKKEEERFNFRNQVSSSELPAKNFLGYECQGYQLRTSTQTVDYYLIPGSGVTIPASLLQNLNLNLPRLVLDKLIAENRELIVSMEIKNNTNNARIALIECTELNEIGFEFETEGYTIR